ncbi:glycosyltransferase family 2 protein [Aequorivita viscosa]|uniref:Glycosyl transferase family 2 n=1 Tax=Aequorivita viscosa TaxID=797419 RepID=A0A1M6GIX4_9FLAO|nr:Glycosyl transferase family 2 [Aequorivita viscosa]SHJ09869.1 Glycosyl transferase family 2 [Aequorivita viscosa]
MDKNPLISICCITYNHGSFIRQCLDGFLMQQCNFEYEILIYDDASTYSTSDIIRENNKKSRVNKANFTQCKMKNRRI